jgi:predicted nuclease of predicted toxin-antitoxin system
VKFLIDAQLPPALALWLTQAGHEAVHVNDIGLREAEDTAIWEQAVSTGAALVTKDEDFVARAAHAGDANPPVILWLRVGNTTNRVLRVWLDERLAGILDLVNQGNRVIEVI